MVREASVQETPEGALKIEYEFEVDVLTIYLQEPNTLLSHSSEAKSGIIVNYAKDGSLSSIEILNASERFGLTAYSVAFFEFC